jgi:integrase
MPKEHVTKRLTDPLLRKLITTALAEANKEGGKDVPVPLDGQGGYLIGRTTGKVSLVLQDRINGVQIKRTYKGVLPTASGITRWLAVQRDLITRGIDPRDAEREAKVARQLAEKDSLRSVIDRFLVLEEQRGERRYLGEMRKQFERWVYPWLLVGKPVSAIRRSDYVRLFDDVERTGGTRIADVTTSNLRIVLDHYSERADGFVNPLHRLKRRSKAGPRQRILSDAELVKIWRACDEMQPASFGQGVKLLLCTAGRRNEILHARFDELVNDGRDLLVPAARVKAKPGHRHDLLIPLSGLAREIIGSMPRENELIFPSRDGGKLRGFAEYKKTLDRLSDVADWRLHDLRRTARSLMSRAGVNADIGERAIGHKITGIRGTYDVYSYHAERAAAFESLARLITRIVNPAAADNVTELRPMTG